MENPKIRFKGFTKDWEQRKLGDIGSTVMAAGKTKDGVWTWRCHLSISDECGLLTQIEFLKAEVARNRC